jgi:hypothetical protein
MKAKYDLEHPLYHANRNGFFCFNRRRRAKGKRELSFKEYLAKRKTPGPKRERQRAQSTRTNVDPVFLAHKNAYQGYNSNRRGRGLGPLTFQEYLDHISKPAVNGDVSKLPTVAERDFTPQWKAENEKRRARGQLPLKYDEFVKHWKDWI